MSEGSSKPKRDPTFGGVNVFGGIDTPTLDRAARLSAAEQADKAFADIEAELALEEKLKNEAKAASEKAEADRAAMEKYQAELAEYNRKMEEYKVAKAKHDADVAARAAYEEAELKREAEAAANAAAEAAAKKAEDDIRAEAERKANEAAASHEKQVADEMAKAQAERDAAVDREKQAAAEEDAAAARLDAEIAAKAQEAANAAMSAETIAFEAEAARLRQEAEAAVQRQQAALDYNTLDPERQRLAREELDRVAREEEEQRKRTQSLATLNVRDDAARQALLEAERIAAERARSEKSQSNDLMRQIMEAEKAAAARKKAEKEAAEEAAKTEAERAKEAEARATTRAQEELARVEKEAGDRLEKEIADAAIEKARQEMEDATRQKAEEAAAAEQAAAAAAAQASATEAAARELAAAQAAAEADLKAQMMEAEARNRMASDATVISVTEAAGRRASSLSITESIRRPSVGGKSSSVPDSTPASIPEAIAEAAPTPAPASSATSAVDRRASLALAAAAAAADRRDSIKPQPQPVAAPLPVIPSNYVLPTHYAQEAHPLIQLTTAVGLGTNNDLHAALDENTRLKHELARLLKLDAAVSSGQLVASPALLSASASSADQDLCRRVFEEFDIDRSGYMDVNELSLLALQLGQAMDESELRSAATAMDLNGDGKITFAEFWAWWSASQGGARAVGPETGALKLTLLKAKLYARQAARVAAAVTTTTKDEKARVTGDYYANLGATLATNPILELNRTEPIFRLTLEAGTPPSASQPAAVTLGAKFAPELPADLQALTLSNNTQPNHFTAYDVIPNRRSNSTPADIRDAVSDLYAVLSAGAASGKTKSVPPTWHVGAGPNGFTRVTIAQSIGSEADLKTVNPVPVGLRKMLSGKWERAYGWADLLDARKGLSVGDITGNFRALFDLQPEFLRVALAAMASSPITDPTQPPESAHNQLLISRMNWSMDMLEYARWGMSVAVNVRVSDYAAEARQLLQKYAAKNITDGVDLDLLRLFTTPATDKFAESVYGLAEVQRNQSRSELSVDLSRIRSLLKVAERDIEEIAGVTQWYGRAGAGIALSIDGGGRLAELNTVLGFASSAASRPPPVPANWVQTISRGRYPASSSRDDDEVRSKLASGHVPSSVIAWLKTTPVGVSVVGLQIMYKQQSATSSGGQHVGRIQSQSDVTAKDVKSVTLQLANNEAITKIGLTLASPRNKYLSVTFHTSAGQVWTVGGSAGPYHYVLGNGVNTAFVALTGDFGGHQGALRNLAYWCVGL